MPKDLLYQSSIFVKKSPLHGYGVFAGKDFAAGELIEECYTLSSAKRDPDFNNYYFSAGEKFALPLGYACIYNHSNTPNTGFTYDAENGLTIFTALRAVAKGEELCTSYGPHWFADRNLKVKTLAWWRRLTGLALRAMLVFGSLLALMQGLKHLSF